MKYAATTLLLLLLGVEPATAQDASARAQAADLFNQGRSDVQAGHFADACPKFEESLRLDPQIGTKLNLANCFEQIGRLASAWGLYTEVVETAKDPDDRSFAEAAATKLQPRVPRLAINASMIEGLEVKLDGTVVKPGLPRAVDPGGHKIAFSAPGRVPRVLEVVATEGQTTKVDMPELVPTAPTSDPAPSPSTPTTAAAPATDEEHDSAPIESVGMTSKRKLALAVGGVGVAALAVGLGFGWKAKSAWDDAHSNGHCDSNEICDDTGFDRIDDAYSSATISTIGVGVGVAALGVGAFLWFTGAAPQHDSEEMAWRPVIHRDLLGASVQGSF